MQAARFYVPATGAIALLGAWLLVRVPRRASLAAVTSAAVVAAMFGLGVWSYNDMRNFSLAVHFVHGPGPHPVKAGPAVQAGPG